MNKTLIIAATTYREIVRRPLYWGVVITAALMMGLSALLPYFTFGEDLKMVQDQGFSILLVAGAVLGLFSASIAIADELEGRTALTLLSKPVRRRHFLVGKFVGIMLGVAMLTLLLSIVFAGVIWFKMGNEALENKVEIPSMAQRWALLGQLIPGIVLTYCQVMILTAISVAFSTRFPVALNLTTCIALFLLGRVVPLLEDMPASQQSASVKFVAQFFATILPGMEYFNVGPAIANEATIPWIGYVVPCLAYAGLYTAIAMVLGLLLFEDRDLA